MSIVVLFQSEILTLASTSRVIPAHEVGTLDSMLEQSASLTACLAAEELRLRNAETDARLRGHSAGYSAGKKEGLDSAAEELTHERSELAQMRAQVHQQATSMAFDIVRKLADTIDPVELLSALAISAARSCQPDEARVLRVHEQYRNAVAEKLKTMESVSRVSFRHVVGDSTVEPSTCIIESQASRILADLETQTDLLESQLVNG